MKFAIEAFGIRDGETFGIQFAGTGKELGQAVEELQGEIDAWDRCARCGAILHSEDFHRESQIADTSVMAAVETLALGYTCPHCGFSEGA